MAKDVISVHGKDVVVREDTAKSYRGVIWGLTSIAIFIIVLAILTLGGFIHTTNNGKVESPSKIEESTGR